MDREELRAGISTCLGEVFRHPFRRFRSGEWSVKVTQRTMSLGDNQKPVQYGHVDASG